MADQLLGDLFEVVLERSCVGVIGRVHLVVVAEIRIASDLFHLAGLSGSSDLALVVLICVGVAIHDPNLLAIGGMPVVTLVLSVRCHEICLCCL